MKSYKVWDENGKIIAEITNEQVEYITNNVIGRVTTYYKYIVFEVNKSVLLTFKTNTGIIKLYLFDKYIIQLDKSKYNIT
jgi:hypothetical protein